MYEVLINQVKQTILEQIQNNLQSSWLDRHSREISQLVDAKIKKTEIALAEKLQYTPIIPQPKKSFQLNPTPPTPVKTTYVHGILIREDQRYLINVTRWDVIKEVNKEFQLKFINDIWLGAGNIQETLSAQLARFEPEIIMEQFFARHPWLRLELKETDSPNVSYRFLFKLLSDNLLSKLNPKLSSWTDISKDQLLAHNFSWGTLDQGLIQRQIEGYPLSNVKSLYADRTIYNLPNLELTLLLTRSWQNYAFTRVDILRLLAQNYSSAMQATYIGGTACTKIAPLHRSELSQLSAYQWEHYHTLLVNLEVEGTPLWIMLHKKGHQWTAYIPQFIKAEQIRSLKIPGLQIETVDYTNNTALSDITKLASQTQWHAVLLSRVLPWSQESQKPLTRYRDKTPLPFLLQDALYNCMAQRKK